MKLTSRFLSTFGHLWEWLIQRWVQYTGRKVQANSAPWLAGPVGARKIGPGFYESFARKAGLSIKDRPHAGLLPSFDSLRSGEFEPDEAHPEIANFYEKTADYALDAWVQWTGPFSPFARFMISAISRNIEQLILPLTPLMTSHGMSSRITSMADPQTGDIAYSGWLRTTIATGDIVYAGFYTTCQPPNHEGHCVKVVFPLPQGSATVILKPVNVPGGSFKLVSAGRKFGGPGYYRIHRLKSGELRVKQIPIKETIHVYMEDGVLRTDHHFKFWKFPFLTLHYKITRKPD